MRFFLICFSILFLLNIRNADAEKILNIQPLDNPYHIQAWLVEDKTVPVISLSFSFDGGLMLEDENKSGVAKLMSDMLDEGAGDLTSLDFQQRLNDMSISLRFSAGRDAFSGDLKTLKTHKNEAFRLLSLSLSKPRLDQDAIDRMLAANIQSLTYDKTDPDYLAARSFNGMIFQNHPYNRPGAGRLSTLSKLTRDDLLAYHQKQFTRTNLKVVIVGDITAKEAQNAISIIFGGLPEAKDTKTNAAEFATLNYQGKIIHLPFNIPQTIIIAGHKAPTPQADDYMAAVILDYILGSGGFSARLTKEIREKRGLTYGISSSLNHLKYADLWQVRMATQNENVAQSIALIKKEWQRLSTDGITAEELDHAKAYLTGALPLQFSSTSKISSILNGFQQLGYDADYINRYATQIKAVTIQDVNKAAQKYLKANQLTFIVVGQPAKPFKADLTLEKAPGID